LTDPADGWHLINTEIRMKLKHANNEQSQQCALLSRGDSNAKDRQNAPFNISVKEQDRTVRISVHQYTMFTNYIV